MRTLQLDHIEAPPHSTTLHHAAPRNMTCLLGCRSVRFLVCKRPCVLARLLAFYLAYRFVCLIASLTPHPLLANVLLPTILLGHPPACLLPVPFCTCLPACLLVRLPARLTICVLADLSVCRFVRFTCLHSYEHAHVLSRLPASLHGYQTAGLLARLPSCLLQRLQKDAGTWMGAQWAAAKMRRVACPACPPLFVAASGWDGVGVSKHPSAQGGSTYA